MEKIQMYGPWMTKHEIRTVMDCMKHGWYSYEYVEAFQKEFSSYHNRKYGIMTPNCTTAIHLLLTAMGIKDGDEVITPECTWIGSTAGISYLRASPIFCDIDSKHWCINPESVRKNITSKTKAIIAVDLFGNMPLMNELFDVCNSFNIPIVEDAAEALGSTYKGIKAGKFGIGSVFSFHRTKTLAIGESGMLLLDDDNLYDRCMFLRDHGRKSDGPTYYNYEVTYKYMPSNLQAAVGYAQFQRIEELIKKKRWIFESYKEQLRDIEDIELNADPDGGFNSVWITGLLLGKSYNMNKLDMINKLKELDIPSRPFFYPLSSLPAYGSLDLSEINPISYDICNRGINLPGALIMTQSQIDVVCEGIHKILKRK